MRKKDCKLKDYKVKKYGKPVMGKSYSEENAVLFEEGKRGVGKGRKKDGMFYHVGIMGEGKSVLKKIQILKDELGN